MAVAPSVASLLAGQVVQEPMVSVAVFDVGVCHGPNRMDIASGESVSHVTDIGLPREEIITEESLRRML